MKSPNRETVNVHVQSLTKIYGSQTAVDAISFQAKPGEILGFLGPNGAGKTTTMKMLTTFLEPTDGTAEVCGFDILEQPMEVRRRIGYLPEHNPLYLNMYVREYLRFMAGLYQLKNARQRVEEMIEQTGLSLESRKPIRMLSKGYRQRVGLAQALLHDPEVLILDEPTSGLDPNQLTEIRNLIRKLGQEKTVIFSSHIMQEVQALCDRVIILNRGKIVADDPIDQLQSRLKGETVVYLELGQEVKAEDLEKIPGVRSVEKGEGLSWRLHAHTTEDVREAIFHEAVKQKWVILGMQKESYSVEDVFQELTRG